MELTEKARQITERIYAAYGSDSGILFGIPADDRCVVMGIVRCVLLDIEANGLD